jgi:hypothetical protein
VWGLFLSIMVGAVLFKDNIRQEVTFFWVGSTASGEQCRSLNTKCIDPVVFIIIIIFSGGMEYCTVRQT